MREGKYIVESIESNIVKLLLAEDEVIEEFVKMDSLINKIKQGDVVLIAFKNDEMVTTILEDETQNRKNSAKNLMKKLMDK